MILGHGVTVPVADASAESKSPREGENRYFIVTLSLLSSFLVHIVHSSLYFSKDYNCFTNVQGHHHQQSIKNMQK